MQARRSITCFAVVVCGAIAGVLLAGVPALALETDQYTVPPAPLADVGPQLQQHVRAMLQQVAGETNIAYLDHKRRAVSSLFPWDRAGHAAAADRMQTGDHLAEAFYKATGPSLIESEIEVWVRNVKVPAGPHTFEPSVGDSVYGANPLGRPITLQSLSPTVNAFGHYLGTDKIGHFFDEGYKYYQAFRAAEREGRDVTACVRRALESGVSEEKHFFGLLTVGVYSNADLAANYAGFKFFLNLTRPVLVNGRRLPPMLVKRQDLWQINPDLSRDFLDPFISDHFNESLNPSFYNDQLRETVRAQFPARAARWAAFYNTDAHANGTRVRSMTTYYGEPYGHSGMDGVITAAEMIAVARPAAAAAKPAAVVQRASHAVPTASVRE